MKILYVTAVALEYNSSANIRNRALIAGLIAQGHQVSSLSVQPQREAILYESENLDTLLKRYEIPLRDLHSKVSTKKRENVLIRKLKRLLAGLYQHTNIYDSRIIYAKEAESIRLTESYDAVISSSDPKSSHRIAEAVIRNNRERVGMWVQYWGDPFASDINLRAGQKSRKAKQEEERLLALADRVVYTSPETLNRLKDVYGLPEDKAFFIPTPYGKTRIYPVREKHDGCTLLYTGNYYSRDRDMMPLVQAVMKNRGVRLVLVGETDLDIPEHENIVRRGRVPYAELAAIEENADVLVCLLNRKGTQIPGKAFQYAATNKPILMLYEETSDAIVRYFEKTGRYVMLENCEETIGQMLQNVDSFLERTCAPYGAFSADGVAAGFIEKIVK